MARSPWAWMQTWKPRPSSAADHLGQLVALEVQDARTVRRDRVAAVNGRGAAAHPAVGPDLHRLAGQPGRVTARQAGFQQPADLVVHHQPVDPQAQLTARVRVGEGGEGVPAHVRVTGRSQAERGQPPGCCLDEPGPRHAVHGGQVMTQIGLEQREHRALVQHAVQTAVGVPAEGPAGGIGLPVVEAGLAQRGRVEDARVQRGVVEHGRPVRHGLVEVCPGRVPPLGQLVLHVPAPRHPGALRSARAGLGQPCPDGRDVRCRWLAAVRGGREVAHVGDVAVRVDQARHDGGPVQPHHLRARAGCGPHPLCRPGRGDPPVPDQQRAARSGLRLRPRRHGDHHRVLDDQFHGPALPAATCPLRY